MAQLAIKGHLTRGKEVIEILEMLGGKNTEWYDGSDFEEYYIIEEGDITQAYDWNNHITFTLEEFLEKFPFKVGDKVQHKGATSCASIYIIEQMKWEDNQVKYIICNLYWKNCKYTLTSKDLQPYKEETMEETDTINHTTEINLNHPCFGIGKCNEIELIIPAGWEFEQRGNKMFGVRKQYPNTYEECCEVLGKTKAYQSVSGYKNELLEDFQKLLICRDAYWKIVGDWKPDWNDESEIYYTISYNGINIKCYNYTDVYSKLAFPTAEMRDAFYENFKDLIEQCKELL